MSVKAAGHTILNEIDLVVDAGSHIAIVGPSGAGKSSLVGMLLGWHRPAAGRIIVDGHLLSGSHLEKLRKETAWVDPAVQLWNRSFLNNLYYGAPIAHSKLIGHVIEMSSLHGLINKLPDGLQTQLGEGGGLVSGGEGQRVRLGRAMLRPEARLVIFDEAFRGLDREQRKKLLVRARRLWRHATFLCITHDISDTTGFGRVLVVEDGRITEDGKPADLIKLKGSRYRAMLKAEIHVRRKLWSNSAWRRLRIDKGCLVENSNTF